VQAEVVMADVKGKKVSSRLRTTKIYHLSLPLGGIKVHTQSATNKSTSSRALGPENSLFQITAVGIHGFKEHLERAQHFKSHKLNGHTIKSIRTFKRH
jgi:hypothetical protein